MIKNILARFLGRKHTKRPVTRSNQARTGGRTLTMESLEGRELMAVAVVGRTFKEFEFAGPVSLSGNISGRYGTQPVSGRLNGNLNITGEINYTSQADGVGQVAATGPVNAMIYGYGNLPALNMDGSTEPGGLVETAGKFNATLPADGPAGPATLNGAINTKDFSAKGTIQFTLYDTIIVRGNWSGRLSPVDPQPLDVTTTAQWDPVKFGTVDVDVTAAGSVQKAANRNAAVATVNVYWGNDAGVAIRRLPDVIPVLWNQATGSYEISNLPSAPALATKLILVTKYGTVSKTLTLDLPARPTVSISNVAITPPAVGTGDAVFTVSLSGPTLSTVKVKFSVLNGTAVKGEDFTAKNGTLTFLPGGPTTQSIIVKAKRDATPGSEEFFVQLGPPTWASLDGTGRGTGTISF